MNVIVTTLRGWLADGPRLVRENVGLTRVELTDYQPICARSAPSPDGTYATYWFWDSAYNLPRPELFPYFQGNLEGREVVRWPTREEALDALSGALLAWARDAAKEQGP